MTYFNAIKYSDSGSLDAFARLRTSSPFTIFDSKQLNDKAPLFWDEVISNVSGNATSTHSTTDSAVTMAVGANAGDYIIRQTKMRFNYQPGKCVWQEEYITTSDGEYLKVKNLIGKDFKLVTIDKNGNKVIRNAKADWNAYEDIFTIKTKTGNEAVRNQEHPFWVARKKYDTKWIKGNKPKIEVIGWVKLKDIKVGDLIARTEKLDIFGNDTRLSIDDAKILGYLIGDGGTVKGITFTQSKNIQLDEFKKLIESRNCKMVTKKDNQFTFNIFFNGGKNRGKNEIINLCKENDIYGKRCWEKTIPECIFNSPKEIIATFLSRLYSTDGWASAKSGIGYGSTSKQLILDIKKLLLKFGIHGDIRKKHPKCNGKVCKTCWELNLFSKKDIELFKNEIGIFGKEFGVNECYESVINKKESYKQLFKKKNINENLLWDEVESIENSGKDWTVAIEVDTDHTYLTDFYEHNSHLIIMTGVMSTQSGVTKRIGYYNSSTVAPYTASFDGLYFENNGTNVSVNVAKSGTITTINQSSWNIDTMNGNGPSKITIDWSKAQIFFIDFEWLGVGRVRYGLFVNGIPYYVHQVLNANAVSSVYMSSPNHSVRYAITSNGSAGSMTHICSTVVSEGGLDQNGMIFCAGHDATQSITTNNDNNNYALVGIRLKTTHFGSTIIPKNVSVAIQTASDFRWSLLLNPTVGGTFTYSDITNSSVQQALGSANTNTVTGGTLLQAGVVSTKSDFLSIDIDNALRIGSSIAGTQDTLVLCAARISGTTETMRGSIIFRDLQ